jgi:hypothetical protein
MPQLLLDGEGSKLRGNTILLRGFDATQQAAKELAWSRSVKLRSDG